MRAQSPLYLIAKSSGSRDLCSVKVAMSRALAPLHLSFCYIFLPSASKLCTAVGCEICEYRGGKMCVYQVKLKERCGVHIAFSFPVACYRHLCATNELDSLF